MKQLNFEVSVILGDMVGVPEGNYSYCFDMMMARIKRDIRDRVLTSLSEIPESYQHDIVVEIKPHGGWSVIDPNDS